MPLSTSNYFMIFPLGDRFSIFPFFPCLLRYSIEFCDFCLGAFNAILD